jgi:alginate O-acetyltransferase complex protein AlgI
MLFTSLEFFVFFAAVFALYYLPVFGRWQAPLLVAASLCFYAWSSPRLLLLLALSIFINASASFQASRVPARRALWWAIAAVAANLAILGFFKYGKLIFGLLVQSFSLPTPPDTALWLLINLPLPIGISFYTFEGISLIVDVYRRRKKEAAVGTDAELVKIVSPYALRHVLHTSLFVTFFPHLIAGPILKAAHFFPQIGRKRFRDIAWAAAVEALIIGYFLKMVVADNLNDLTFWISYPVYQALNPFTGLAILYGYSIQIFADFAGYSLIAVGLGRLLGYDLPNNFNFPYISRSLSEFWHRWHISLSTWLRDYLYIPLGGNRRGDRRTYLNLMIVMTLGGLWHGAAWSYAIWGIYHGAGLALERWITSSSLFGKLNALVRSPWLTWCVNATLTLCVFCFVTLGWLLFKLPSGFQAVDFVVTMAKNWQLPINPGQILTVLLFSLPVVVYHFVHYPLLDVKWLQVRPWWFYFRQSSIAVALVLIVLNSGSQAAFVYFQF